MESSFVCLAVFVCALIVTSSASVRADDAPPAAATQAPPGRRAPRLALTLAPGCADEQTFLGEVALLLNVDNGVNLFSSEGPDELRVTFSREAGRYVGVVQLVPEKGDPWPEERKVGDHCGLIFRAVARLASMYVPAVAPGVGSTSVAQEGAGSKGAAGAEGGEEGGASGSSGSMGAQGQESGPAPGEIQGREATVGPRSRQAFRRSRRAVRSWGDEDSGSPLPPDQKRMDLTIGLNALVLMSIGYTDNVGAGVQVGADVRGEIFSFGVEARFLIPQRQLATLPADVGGPYPRTRALDASMLAVNFVPCGRWKYFAGCGVLQVGSGLSVSHDYGTFVVVPRFAAGPRLRVEVPVSDRFAFVGTGEVLFGLGETAVVIVDSANQLEYRWPEPLVQGYLGAGMSVTFK